MPNLDGTGSKCSEKHEGHGKGKHVCCGKHHGKGKEHGHGCKSEKAEENK